MSEIWNTSQIASASGELKKFVLSLKNLLILVIPSLGTSRKPGRRLLRERVERKALNGQNNRSAFESLVEFSVSLC